MFVLVCMQLRNHINAKAVKFSALPEAMRYTYDIKSKLLLVHENDISLHKWSVGTAHCREVVFGPFWLMLPGQGPNRQAKVFRLSFHWKLSSSLKIWSTF